MGFKNVIRWLTPFGIIEHRRKKVELLYKLEIERGRKIKKYFQNLDRNNIDPEVLEIIKYFDNNPFSVLPYDFTRKYDPTEVDVCFDKASKIKYVLHNNKRLYFPKTWETGRICRYYANLCKEQDTDSPHRYETPEFTVKDGDTIADIGAAEGIWALTYVEKAEKIYLFECCQEWITALKKTFEPWKEKVIIVNKYISNVTEKEQTTLDDFINGGKINLIKADIEGMEINLLEGGIKTLTEATDLKLLLCAYHNQDDAEKLRSFLEAKGFSVENSKGYILSYFDKNVKEPYMRRGVLRAKKYNDIPR